MHRILKYCSMTLAIAACVPGTEQDVADTHSLTLLVQPERTFLFGSGNAEAVVQAGDVYVAEPFNDGYVVWAGESFTVALFVPVPYKVGFLLDNTLCTTGLVKDRLSDAKSHISNNGNNYDVEPGICFTQA